MTAEILIVDDEADIRIQVRGLLQDEGYKTREAHHAESALAALNASVPDLVLLDIWLEGSHMDGMELLTRITEQWPDLPVLMISGHGSIETAVRAIKIGAYDFIQKPFKTDHFLHLCSRAIEAHALRQENKQLKKVSEGPERLTGDSAAIQSVYQSIEKAAPTKSRVMILGEPGTGKGIVARMLHDHSDYKKGPFHVMNCALTDADTFESMLLGEEDKAGNVIREGLLEKANGGTLFFDEVSDLSPESQAKLLQILQSNSFTRFGGKDKISVDIRFIASSNSNLEKEMNDGSFRQDLYYRLAVVPIHMPSLRKRQNDIMELAEQFMNDIAQIHGKPAVGFSDDVIPVMQSYEWPGNVRQLRNVIEWLFIMYKEEGKDITASMLPPEMTSKVSSLTSNEVSNNEIMGLPLRQAREIFEREYLLSQVNRFGGNISRTASFVGMERSALHRKLKSLGIQNGEKNDAEETQEAQRAAS